VKIKEENQTLATITLQNYFRLYDKLAGMTGTATTEAAEFANTYGLQAVPIPTNKPPRRTDHSDLIYKAEDSKFEAVVEDLVERYDTGQPVLVGTISVEKSEHLSTLLKKRGVPHEVLNAKQHFREAEIVAQAGRLHAITVATNMAGRGVDIILGGNPEGLALRDLRAEELDPDTEEGQARLKVLEEKHEAECRAEGEKVRELGGLYVLGTERHESRRIDNQLRGRSGRQGDPGESRFYLSLEDELMRLFATGAMAFVMNKAFPDDMPLESKMVTKSVEKAQNTVEARNAEIRKNVLKYDEVMNEQRKVVYGLRNQILEGQDLRDRAMEELAQATESVIANHCVSEYSEEWNLDGLAAEIRTFWPSGVPLEEMQACSSTDQLYELLMAEAVAHYEQREKDLGEPVMREVERQVMMRIIDQKWREHLEEMDYLREGINLRAMGQKDPLTEWQREGFAMFEAMMGGVAQDFVRYAMQVQVNVTRPGEAAVGAEAPAPAAALPTDPEPEVRNLAYSAPDESSAGGGLSAAALAAGPEAPPKADEPPANTPTVKSDWDKTPRNAPCPCGSGKKFKMCHGK
jgi:preprotein translocase subunit SecA